VAYYGRHYYGYFRDFGEDLWRLCDDAQVRVLGAWEAVLGHCLQARSRPVLLLYEQLTTEEQRRCATAQHFLNELLSASTFGRFRDAATEQDRVAAQLNAPEELDPEIQE
jgi:hypothetical protein